MKKIGIIFICMMLVTSFLVVFPVENVKAEIVTFDTTDDTVITIAGPDLNWGNIDEVDVRNAYGYGGDPIWENDILIKFDVSSLPSDATIIVATLKLYFYRWVDNSPIGTPLNLYRITSFWDEDTVTWNTQPNYAMQPTTYSIVPSSFGWMSWDVTNDVQGFLDGSFTNFGWKIMDENYWGGPSIPNTYFYSKEYGNYIPYLEIEMEPNNPPNTPSKPNGPTSGWVDAYIEFSANATDPDNDQIKYGWDWNGDNTIDEWTGLLPSGNTCYKTHKWYEAGTYYIKVKAKDSKGDVSGWSDGKTIQILVQNQNNPPNIPTNPYPENGAMNISTDVFLTWSGGDPDAGDTVTYDVYFGSVLPIQKIVSNLSITSLELSSLANSLTYFWNIVAWDNNGASTVGPSWHFTTTNITNNPPNEPLINGPNTGKPNSIYSCSFIAVDPEGDDILYEIDWGDGNVDPWSDSVKSNEKISRSHTYLDKGNFTIMARAKDIYGNIGDWGTLTVTMPKSKTYTPFGFIFVFGFDVDVKIVQLEPGEDYVDLEVLSKPFYIWENEIQTRNPGEFIRLYNAKGLFSPSLPFCFGICEDWGIIG